MTVLLQLDDVAFHYPDAQKAILNGVSLTIDAGDTVRITGRNGAGKSSLMKLICGELIPSDGRIIKSRPLRTTYLNQFSGDMLAMDLTVGEIGKGFRSTSLRQSNGDKFIQSLCRFDLGLESRLNDFCGHLSGGQRQAVALAAALASEADILCLDEFTSNLDDTAEDVAARAILGAVDEGLLTAFYTSHGSMKLTPSKTICLDEEN